MVYTDTIGKGLIVDNCTFNTEGKAVECDGDNIEVNTPNHGFSDVRVTNCVSYGAKENYNVGMGFGFAQVDHLVCSGNTLSDIEGSGAIHMEGCTDVESKNNIIKNSRYGIMCIYSQDAVYDNNSIEECDYGIYCMAQDPYGFDERIGFYNNTLNNNLHSFVASGFQNSEILNNVFQSDSNYVVPIIKLDYNPSYETNNVTIAENIINYSGSLSDKNWAYIYGTDCKLYNNKITGISPSSFVNGNYPTIRLKLNLPSNTPMTDTLYFASNLNAWNPADSNYTFTRTSSTTAEIMITVPEDFVGKVEYKITRGGWECSECNASGSGYVGEDGGQNHTLDIYANSGSGYCPLDIINWTDFFK